MKFAIAIEAGTADTAFGVTVPDLPGCFSAGDTIEEAYDNVVEAIEAYVEELAEAGKAIPTTRGLSEWRKNKEFKSWTWGIVDVPVERLFGPAEKINITVPRLLLKRIDDHVNRFGKNRSGFLAEAAVNAMHVNVPSVAAIQAGSHKMATSHIVAAQSRPRPVATRASGKVRHK